jgi:hypothetical protein
MSVRRRTTKLAAAVSTAALVLSLSAGAVLAGEVTGNGNKQHFSQGHSLCKFSGLNDEPDAAFPEGGRTQSYGQLVRLGLKDFVDDVLGASPGVACNPTKAFDE